MKLRAVPCETREVARGGGYPLNMQLILKYLLYLLLAGEFQCHPGLKMAKMCLCLPCRHGWRSLTRLSLAQFGFMAERRILERRER